MGAREAFPRHRDFRRAGALGYAGAVRAVRRSLCACAAALAVACAAEREPEAPEPSAPEPSANEVVEENAGENDDESAEPAAAPELPSVSADGVAARLLDDGRVQVSGADRWGAPLEVTYADVSYFRDALPVLSRGLTSAQADALRAFGERLADEAPR